MGGITSQPVISTRTALDENEKAKLEVVMDTEFMAVRREQAKITAIVYGIILIMLAIGSLGAALVYALRQIGWL